MTPTRSVHALVTGATGGIGRAICFAPIAQAPRDGLPIRVSAAASRQGERLELMLTDLGSACAQGIGVAGTTKKLMPYSTARLDCDPGFMRRGRARPMENY